MGDLAAAPTSWRTLYNPFASGRHAPVSLAAEEFAAVMEPQTEQLVRHLAYRTAKGILDCRNPMPAAHQLMGMRIPGEVARESAVISPAIPI
jgi:AefR-like transcriptional repressor, C-terminal domain